MPHPNPTKTYNLPESYQMPQAVASLSLEEYVSLAALAQAVLKNKGEVSNLQSVDDAICMFQSYKTQKKNKVACDN